MTTSQPAKSRSKKTPPSPRGVGQVFHYLRSEPVALLLIAVPLAIVAEFAEWDSLWVFALSALAVIPMAKFIGDATEALAVHTGPRLGGLLNATLGNAAELIITIVAIRQGLLELVKASITGSILGNLLLVLGMSMLLGGLKHGRQSFDRHQAGINSILLLLVVVTLLIPSLLSAAIETPIRVEALTLGVSVVMLILYALSIFFAFRRQDQSVRTETHRPVAAPATTSAGRQAKKEDVRRAAASTPPGAAPVTPHHPTWSVRTALIILALSTVGVAYLSELLVGAVEPVVVRLGVSEFFLGIILIPIVGNVAEHLVAVKVALQNQMDLSVEIAIASSLQIALFVAPVLVFLSLALGNPLTLIFNEFELIALVTGVIIAAFVSEDGESNWLEGAALLGVYIILGLAFFLLPA